MENKTIVITGASSGVGKNIAKKFVEIGWNVYGISRNIDNIPIGVNKIKADVSDENSVSNAFSQIKKIDVLINNAAIFITKPFIDCSTIEINKIVDTNVKGYMFSTLNAIKKMDNGRIINIGSVSGTHGIKNQAIYSATKFAISGFTDAIAQEFTDRILFTTINPGGIDTELWNDENPYNGDTSKLLKASDISNLIYNIVSLPSNVVIKNITVFPTNEWH